MVKTFIDGTNIAALDLALVNRPKIPTAKRDVEATAVKGSLHGSRYTKYGYEDVPLTLSFNYLEEHVPFKRAYPKIKQMLTAATRLRFSDDDGAYRKVKNVTIGDAENDIAEYGAFDVDLVLDPLYYMPSSLVTLTKADRIYNSGTEVSEPYIKIVGNGDITLTINNEAFVFKGVKDFIELDCYTMNAYKTDTDGVLSNANTQMMTPYFPVLQPGWNTFDWMGTVNSVVIDGRWVRA